MQKLIAILQIQSKNFYDFDLWLKWYTKFLKCNEIYIIDDNSSFDLSQLIEIYKTNNIQISYFKKGEIDTNNIIGENLQVKIYNAILNKIKPQLNDVIIIPDNDEFWWFDKSVYTSFIDCANDFRKNLNAPDALYVPWTLMRSKEILQKRNKEQNYFEAFKYRTNINGCEHKPILFYKGLIDASFHLGYASGKTITQTTNLFYHSKCIYDLPLRCYHFRFTTIKEYNSKRNSDINFKGARPYFKNSFTPQIFNNIDENGKYDILDLTLLNTLKTI